MSSSWMLSAVTLKVKKGATQSRMKVNACTYMLPNPSRSMFQPNTQHVHAADSAHTVPSLQQSHSPPLHSGLLTTTDRL